MQTQHSLALRLCLPAALLGTVTVNGALAQTGQWAAPTRTEQWSSSPAQPPQGKAGPGADAGARPAEGVACPRGARIEVLYAGTWYPARVLDGPDRMGTCLVSYDGYGSNWDEWVNASRMRAPAQAAAPAVPSPEGEKPGSERTPAMPATPAPGKAASQMPAGTYPCYTFDAGQLNYAYTDVVVRGDGRYAVGGKEGRYTLSGSGALTFSGPLSNATGKFSVRGQKPQIDLVFKGNALSSMSCPKAK